MLFMAGDLKIDNDISQGTLGSYIREDALVALYGNILVVDLMANTVSLLFRLLNPEKMQKKIVGKLSLGLIG